MNRNTGMSAGQIIGTMNGQQVVGLDIAKHVFQLHTVNMGTGEIVNVQIKRAKVLEHFANRQSCLIAIEACGGAHHWARELTAQGHRVRLLHAKAVRPFVTGNKTDATDARAIWLAVQQPGVKFVGIKTAAQQATLTLHRQRELMMKMRNMQTNALRGLLYEFGATFAKGRKALFKDVELCENSKTGVRVKKLGVPKSFPSIRSSLVGRSRGRFLLGICKRHFRGRFHTA
jgi:transposase